LYDSLGQAGVLSVAATRNENWDVDKDGDMPTSCPSEYLITVTNTDRDDKKVASAAFGATSIDLGAPGQLVQTTDINARYYDSFKGASSSCPHVSGAVALLYSLPCNDLDSLAQAAPQAAARLVRDAILNGVDPISDLRGRTTTGGRLNVYNSMAYLHNYCLSGKQEREDGSFMDKYIAERGFVNLFPNPASETITVEYSNYDFTKITVQVYNALGQELFVLTQNTEPFQAQRINIEVGGWPNGTYFINLMDKGQKLTHKFVKM
jgi:subtilisin family serine protease